MSVPERNSAKIRILILEEHPLLRHGVADYLNSQPDMIVCGETDNIRDARHKIHECKPHLLLTALRLGTGDSLEFLKALKSERPTLLIVVYSAFEEIIFAERALRAGADGYVMKKAPREELLEAIHEILGGNIYVSHDVAMRAFKKSLETHSEQQHRSARHSIGIEKLSDREMHIFFLLGSGLGNTQIAHSLNLSVKTIESHREHKGKQESRKAGKQESRKAGKQESRKAGKQESRKAGKQESRKAGTHSLLPDFLFS